MNNCFNNEGSAAGHPGLDAVTADTLLEKLSSDDAFRELFNANPILALAELGVDAAQALAPQAPSADDPFYCMTTNQLASKEEIAAARIELQAHLTKAGNQTVIFCFEADKIASTLDNN
ncbi:conserved hypothetical protein [uncultured Stenotrophomonas sp.]|uniref:Uncharacterized protein n=1 Tax=uncultured Stenotrophomonas sp. TaxID=165438 RepID=A0A1Y5QC64_9GAMM|nr:conserved hypothetical protein [uncultured Stenotrophomonas sp.]